MELRITLGIVFCSILRSYIFDNLGNAHIDPVFRQGAHVEIEWPLFSIELRFQWPEKLINVNASTIFARIVKHRVSILCVIPLGVERPSLQI